MELKCIIIDDEQAARNGLAKDIQEIPYLRIEGLAANAYEALEYINRHEPDLLFLDLEMPGLTGIDFLKLIRVRPMVIITTAYPQFALTGFEMGVIDYLLKPISQQRLKLACDKAFGQYALQQQVSNQNNPEDYCYLKCNGNFEKIAFRDILYIEAANNYVFVHTASKKFMAYSSLKSIAAQLPEDHFVQIHKSFIIGKAHIEQIRSNEILINKMSLPLSRNFKNFFRKEVINIKAFRR